MLSKKSFLIIFGFIFSLYLSGLAIAQSSDTSLADELYENALSTHRSGNFTEAVSIFRQAIPLYAAAPDSATIAIIYSRIANSYRAHGDIPQSLEYGEKAIQTGLRHNAHLALSLAYNNKSNIERTSLNYDVSKEFLLQALDYAILSGDVSTIISTYSNLSIIYRESGNYLRSIELLSKANSHLEDYYNPTNIYHVNTNLARSYSLLGNNRQALTHYYVALQAARTLENNLFIARALNNLGLTHRRIGQYRLSRNFLNQALEYTQTYNFNVLHYDVLNNLGLLLRFQRNYEQAEEYYLKSLAFREQYGSPQSMALIYNNLAYLYHFTNRYEEAIPLFEKAIEIRRDLGFRVSLANTISQYTDLLTELGRYDEAIEIIDEAIAIRRELGNTRSLGLDLATKANVLIAKGDYQAAENYLRLVRYNYGENQLSYYIVQLHIDFYRKTNNPELYTYIDEFITRMERSRRGMGHSATVRGRFFEEQAQKFNNYAYWYLSDNGDIEKAYRIIEATKARTLIDGLSQSSSNLDQYWTDEQLQERLTLEKDLNNLRIDFAHEQDSLKRRQVLRQISSKELEYENFINRVIINNAHLSRFALPEPLSIEQTQQLLDENTLLLNFAVSDEALFGIAVSKNSFSGWAAGNDTESFDRLIFELRSAIINEREISEIRTISGQLYDKLLSPVQHLIDSFENIIIVADANLAFLPFEVLTHEDKYLIETHKLKYMPSATAMSYISKPLDKYEQKMLIVADPDYQVQFLADISNGAMTSLPSSRLEARAIRNVFPGAELISGERANFELIKSLNLEKYQYLHFATHGIINHELPEVSGLLLSPVIAGESELVDNSLLTIGDIYSMNISSELVVLSACETGLGKTLRGEGVIGLPRAFLISGASSVVSSLWTVYDQSTARFMGDFYTNIRDGERAIRAKPNQRPDYFGSKAGHLRDAKLHMISSGRYAHPVYWAPFILIGN